ncbi:MAG: glutamate 5-kinase [Pseudomonadales bacterium]|nr:glutamate 5-kinase [Pseudomonadales bacterium]
MKITQRDRLASSKRWVVKIGSSLLTAGGQGLDQRAISGWVDQIATLRNLGVEVVLVSSGAVAEGMSRLGLERRPSSIHELQAAAAVGQMGLVQAYETCFQRHQVHTAQILLTHEDLSDRKRYLNARSTMLSLLDMGVVPVVNENDTVVTDEVRFGDNDTLGALVANLIEADVLVILTDQSGMFDKDPREHNDAQLLDEVRANDPSLVAMATVGGGGLGCGGMATKVRSAILAARSGSFTVIAGGDEVNILLRVRASESVGTLMVPDQEPIAARKQWLAGHLQMKGRLELDDGAVRVLQDQGRSLLPVGIRLVEGEFRRGEVVECVDSAGRKVACGMVNYSADEARQIAGFVSDKIESILGYIDQEELIHRDNLVVF